MTGKDSRAEMKELEAQRRSKAARKQSAPKKSLPQPSGKPSASKPDGDYEEESASDSSSGLSTISHQEDAPSGKKKGTGSAGKGARGARADIGEEDAVVKEDEPTPTVEDAPEAPVEERIDHPELTPAPNPLDGAGGEMSGKKDKGKGKVVGGDAEEEGASKGDQETTTAHQSKKLAAKTTKAATAPKSDTVRRVSRCPPAKADLQKWRKDNAIELLEKVSQQTHPQEALKLLIDHLGELNEGTKTIFWDLSAPLRILLGNVEGEPDPSLLQKYLTVHQNQIVDIAAAIVQELRAPSSATATTGPSVDMTTAVADTTAAPESEPVAAGASDSHEPPEPVTEERVWIPASWHNETETKSEAISTFLQQRFRNEMLLLKRHILTVNLHEVDKGDGDVIKHRKRLGPWAWGIKACEDEIEAEGVGEGGDQDDEGRLVKRRRMGG